MKVDYGKIKDKILDFTTVQVKEFLEEHSDELFIAFGYYISSYYGSLHICFETKEHYENEMIRVSEAYDKFPEERKYRPKEESIIEGVYYPPDWEYGYDEITQEFIETDDFSELEYEVFKENMIVDEGKQTSAELLLNTFLDALVEFIGTETFKSIPKTDNFKVICYDYDDRSVIESSERMMELSSNKLFNLIENN